MSNYEYLNDIKFILAQIKIKNERFEFIETAFNDSFDRTFTRIYNDTEISKPLFLIEELPEKTSLQKNVKEFLKQGGKIGWTSGELNFLSK